MTLWRHARSSDACGRYPRLPHPRPRSPVSRSGPNCSRIRLSAISGPSPTSSRTAQTSTAQNRARAARERGHCARPTLRIEAAAPPVRGTDARIEVSLGTRTPADRRTPARRRPPRVKARVSRQHVHQHIRQRAILGPARRPRCRWDGPCPRPVDATSGCAAWRPDTLAWRPERPCHAWQRPLGRAVGLFVGVHAPMLGRCENQRRKRVEVSATH